jgi:hypothetical protein
VTNARIRSQAEEVKRALTSPAQLLSALGLESKRTSPTRYQIRCPWHADRSPSCHVFTGNDGTIRAHCFPCGKSANGITLARAVLGLGFRDALVWCAKLANQYALADEIAGGREAPALPERPVLPPPRPYVPREYPDLAEVRALLASCIRATKGPAHDYLAGRNIVPSQRLLILRADADLPAWASRRDPETRRSVSWVESGHRLILPMYDMGGQLRSVRAWRIPSLGPDHSDSPKRLPPSGKRASGLSLMTPAFAMKLRNHGWPLNPDGTTAPVLVVEGEPDFLAACSVATLPVLGHLSGSDAPPAHVPLIVATHPDPAGNLYSNTLIQSREGWPSPVQDPGAPPATPCTRLTPPCDLSDMPRHELARLLKDIHVAPFPTC